jgi:multidrug efflux pump subunit AcrA (membrane-fusion protein)
MDSNLTTASDQCQAEEPDSITEAELNTALAIIARIAPIAERRNALAGQISHLEHPTGWAISNNHAARASFDYLDEDGESHLSYQAYEREDNEYYTLTRAELLDPNFEAAALARIAQLEECNRLAAQAESERKVRAAAAAERAQYERLRAKFEPGSDEPLGTSEGGRDELD